ncbi:MAG: thioredoxin domain-containing protein [Opitutales bacterium]
MPNRLANENSLYLRQHKDNPVDWHPWGAEAFEAARAADKPLLVSVGYSACHWCHVMAHESFEDSYIADLMNKHFVCVKVDREERPDVDQVYIEAVRMIQQHAGWPLNVFCLPDGRPFFGGTYFPAEDRGQGMIPWPQVLMRIADYYKRSREELVENADAIQKNIISMARPASEEDEAGWNNRLLVEAARGICGNYDQDNGGFGGAPKFPPSMALNFLQTVGRSAALEQEDPALARRTREVRRGTLDAIARGGLFDQFGGGFARYCVDAQWTIPHFEKMLYDNALLIEAYTRAWLDNGNPLYAAVVEETIDWLEREMSAPEGGFYASIDADSEGGEGRYYVWTPEEVEAVLGPEDARAVCEAYHITPEGNFEHGRTHPTLRDTDFSVREQLAPARRALLAHREANRAPPGKDTKISAAWNAMLIRALADAGFYFNRPEWLQRARRGADFLWEKVTEDHAGELRLRAVYYEDAGSRVDGYLHDHALLGEAMLAVGAKVDWLEPGSSPVYIERARRCVAGAMQHFDDPGEPGCFFTADDVATPVARRKEFVDNATPSGNSSLLHALAGLYAWTGEGSYARTIQKSLPAYTTYTKRVASAVAHGLEAATQHAMGIAVIGVREGAETGRLRKALANTALRRLFLRTVRAEEQPADFQVCVGSRCLAPTDDPEDIAEVI